MTDSILISHCLTILFIISNNVLSESTNKTETAISRTGKQSFFPFFSVGVVRFENGICTGASGLQGTCYTRRQCVSADGIGSTRCVRDIGVCCIIQRTCGESSQVNNTYFVSPGFPATYTATSSCSFVIRPINTDVCQVRIDFLTLRLAQPNSNGTCSDDALYVTGGASTVPVICGENTGQHIYVDFNGNSSIVINIFTSGSSIVSRAWNIKVSQINCNCPYRAPSGCLQFYTAASGTVTSFNYGSSGFQNGTRQLANVNYGVCVAMRPGYCSIQWSQSSGSYSFTISGNTYTDVGTATIGTSAAEVFGANCTTDFVVIPGPIFANGSISTTDRFCGNGFQRVTSFSRPFVLTVVDNANELNDVGNRGFSLSFSQQRCFGTALVG